MQNQDQIVKLELSIPHDYQGQRLDVALAALLPEYSRSRIQKWLQAGEITVNGQNISSKTKLQGGEIINICAQLPQEQRWLAQDIQLNVVYEDEDLLIINKPKGLVVHPAAGNPDSTLVNAILHAYPTNSILPRAGIIHRLDKDTSGLLIVAKTLPAQTALVNALQKRRVHREYECIVHGELISGGSIDKPMGRDPRNRLRQAIVENGKPAITHYRVLQRFKGYTHLKVILETGRTHQIRVHMASIGHPIVGDLIYLGRLKFPKGISETLKSYIMKFPRQALHARRVSFEHPITHLLIECSSELPDDFLELLAMLQEHAHGHSS